MGMQGEGVVDGRVLVVKSHYPERHGYRKFTADKVIVLTRNPFDAVDSYFNLGMTNTHTESLDEMNYAWLADLWNEFVPNEMEAWANFHIFWAKRQIPTLTIRFEDLISETQEVMRRVISFMYDIHYEDVPGSTYWVKVNDVVGSKPAGPYKPRSGRVGNSLCHFTPEQISAAVSSHQKILRWFGYDPASQGFPHAQLPIQPFSKCVRTGNPQLFITVNKGKSIRKPEDVFGRNITKVRKRYTQDDSIPFKTKGEASSISENGKHLFWKPSPSTETALEIIAAVSSFLEKNSTLKSTNLKEYKCCV